jgi:hypothetical protein
MPRKPLAKLSFLLLLTLLFAPIARLHAQSPSPASTVITGTDPEPPGEPDVITGTDPEPPGEPDGMLVVTSPSVISLA